MAFPPINPALDRALGEQGYLEPTPVQSAVLAAPSQDQDLLVSAQTGSGKTVAYGLAMEPQLLGGAERMSQTGAPLALIVAPTRELAMQVARELTWLYARTGARVVTCVGGMDARAEARLLNGGCHIVVGTPGRLRDHLDRGNLDFSALQVVVLDEADEMLDLGFREELEAILDVTPPERRTLLFSATIAKDIATLARQYQRAAFRIDTTSQNEPHGDIEYRAIRIAPNEIEHAVVNVLRYFDADRALVFCATREAVRHLHAALRERGFKSVALSGELAQRERTDALQSLRDGHAHVCVATDVAARGLDLPNLDLVIHADLPPNRAGLLHRSGRTGRAGRKGVSVLLTPFSRRRRVEQLLISANIEAIWGSPPSADEIRVRDQARLFDDPMLSEPPAEEDLALARTLLEQRTPEEIAAALIRLHRSRLPAPEELFDSGRAPERSEARPPRERGDKPNAYQTAGDGPWFRLAVGRSANADPKWLIPLICRMGHVTKVDIGQIRIFDRETKFEITKDAEARFLAAIASAPKDKMRIEPAGAPGPKSGPPRRDGGPAKHAGGPRPQSETPKSYAEAPGVHAGAPKTHAEAPRPPHPPKPHGAPGKYQGAKKPFSRNKPGKSNG
jgi:ATP-dependent RNA helicase DeaD